MRAFWLVSASVIFILCGQISILAQAPAYAGCCYYPNCNCVGTKCSGSCPYCCGFRSPEIFQPAFLTGNPMWDKTDIQDSLPLTVGSLDITEQFPKMTRGGECTRRRFTFRMLGNREHTILATSSVRFIESPMSERSLALNIEPQNKE
jgi:hypothetical protein